MRIEQGYGAMRDRLTGEILEEHSYFACAHCHHMVATKTLRSHQYSTCRNCEDGTGRGLICDSPECHAQCIPFMRQVEAMEARARFRSVI